LKKVKEIFFVFGTKNNIIIIIANNKNMKKKIPLMGKDKTILGANRYLKTYKCKTDTHKNNEAIENAIYVLIILCTYKESIHHGFQPRSRMWYSGYDRCDCGQ
jgi:hypothetical protein